MTKTERQQMWLERIDKYKASGESLAVWCRSNNVCIRSMYNYIKKTSSPDQPVSWLPVSISNTKSSPESCLLVRVGQAVIEVSPSFNPALFSAVVKELIGLC